MPIDVVGTSVVVVGVSVVVGTVVGISVVVGTVVWVSVVIGTIAGVLVVVGTVVGVLVVVGTVVGVSVVVGGSGGTYGVQATVLPHEEVLLNQYVPAAQLRKSGEDKVLAHSQYFVQSGGYSKLPTVVHAEPQAEPANSKPSTKFFPI